MNERWPTRQRRKLRKLPVKMGLLLIFLTAFLNCSGCAFNKSVYVLDQAELQKVKAGDKIEAKFDGYVFSNRAIDRVMSVKVDDIKRD